MADESDSPDIGTVVTGGECARCKATDIVLNMQAGHLCVRCVSKGIRARMDVLENSKPNRGPRGQDPTPDSRRGGNAVEVAAGG